MSSTGPNWQAARMPMASPLLLVRCSTNRVWVTMVIQLPTWEMICPLKNSRKLRMLMDRKVSRPAERKRRFTGSPPGGCQ
jgi:hypothetical protein